MAFPQMFAQGPAEEPSGDGPADPFAAPMLFPVDSLLQSALDFSGIHPGKAVLKRPAAARASSSGTSTGKKSKKKASLSHGAPSHSRVQPATVELQKTLEVPGHQPLKMVYGKDRSYIHWEAEFICCLTAKMAQHHSSGKSHAELCLEVARQLAKSSPPSKELALEIRQHVLAESGEL